MAVLLVSFADGAFKARAAHFLAEARQLQLFDRICIYDCAQICSEFRHAHQPFILENQRGFGYWIWKPQVVLQALASTQVGDLVVYMDAGFELNPAGRYRFIEYLEITQASPWQ